MEHIWPYNTVLHQQGVGMLGMGVAFIVIIELMRSVFQAWFSPLKQVPGPFLARYSRLWELFSVTRGKSHRNIIKLHEKYGPVVRLGPNRYCFNSAQAVKTIYSLTRTFPKTSYYDAFSEPGGARALFNSTNSQEHARLRRGQGSLYSMTTIKSYESFVDNQNGILYQKMREFANANENVSLPDFFQMYAFDVIGEMTFGESFHLMGNPSDEEAGMTDLIHKSMIMSATIGLLPEFWNPLIGFLKMLRLPSPKTLYDVALKFMTQYEQSGKMADDEADGSAPSTFTAKVVALRSKGKMNDWEALSVCVNNVIAGSDTTSISLNSAIYHIYTIPRILKRLREEIDDFAQRGEISDPITFAEAQKLPFMRAVINEALRVHPAVGPPLVRNVPQGGAEIDGYFFPEGTEVGVSAWALNYNKDVYGPDAGEFRPERWFEDSVGVTSNSINQFAFGAGSRTCIGRNISMLEMTKVIPQIVRNFDINIDPDTVPWSLSSFWFVKQKYNSTIRLRSEKEE